MARANESAPRRGLTRQAIVARALELGTMEGLDAVSLRRLAADFGVTPMALYRHVRDKDDLINAMHEAMMEDFDATRGIGPSMAWTERLRRTMTNFKEYVDARPLALPLAIAYSGEGTRSFWRLTETLLGILLVAGFRRREAIVLIRVITNLLSGYLLLISQDPLRRDEALGAQELGLRRRQFELVLLGLPRQQFPSMIDGARDMASVWLSNPDTWWRETLDVIVFGLEAKVHKRRSRRP